ncbi:BUD13 homolog [Pantherophis guttatus]|uniref:BUD13 homolog n=1 Tax=Pantherophis guttatus TaxID=94885 RepID=A0A6P9CE68_PANGU|nr:BUD13 homolog [Pantherophis guttatus]
MAAASSLSKAEYLRRRYLEGGDAEAGKKRRRKKAAAAAEGRMRIVDDDDVSWKSRPADEGQEEEEEGDESDLPVVAEFIDERPDEVKWMETFRASNKWKLLGDQNEESQLFGHSTTTASISSSETSRTNEKKHLLDQSPPRRAHHAQPDLSPKREPSSGTNRVKGSSGSQCELFSDERSASQKYKAAAGADLSLPCKKASRAEGDLLLPQKGLPSRSTLKPQPTAASPRKRQRHDSESSSGSSPTRRRAQATSDSDLSPPRATGRPGARRPNSPSDLSPPRRNRHKSSDSDLSPPRRGAEAKKKGHKSRSPSTILPRHQAMESNGSSQRMLSGGKAGLVSADLLRKEQQERKKAGSSNNSKHLEDESRHAKTVFRDEMGRKRDLKQERLEQRKRAEEKSERDEQYAKWGKGLAQSRQQQQNVEDAVKEMQKPLARYIDDQDLDQMLREQEREGDPMADFMRKKKAAKEGQGTKEKPKYNGPAPPLNRFNIWPGYRWDGVDRSNGFEKKRFARIASKKATQELAYKWSVEDM